MHLITYWQCVNCVYCITINCVRFVLCSFSQHDIDVFCPERLHTLPIYIYTRWARCDILCKVTSFANSRRRNNLYFFFARIINAAIRGFVGRHLRETCSFPRELLRIAMDGCSIELRTVQQVRCNYSSESFFSNDASCVFSVR